MGVTLAELQTQSRQRADMEESQFVTDSELTSYINASLAELHDLLIAAYNEDYVMYEHTFTSSNTKQYALPDDFYKIRGLDVQFNGQQWVTVKRFNFNRRNQDQNSFVWNLLGLPYMEYRLVGANIMFNREPTVNSTFRMWYYPKCQQLSAPTDSYDDVNGYSEYVVVDAAIKMMQKEESDVSVLMAQKEALRQRIMAMAQNRDANEPESVTDIYAEDADFYVVSRT